MTIRSAACALTLLLAATTLGEGAAAAGAARVPDVAAAEAVVALDPRVAAARLRLAQAYLAAGRLASAQAAFLDTLALDPRERRAALGLALVEVAAGRVDGARRLLDQHGAAAADAGLALALAGDVEGAIRRLIDAARVPGADGRTRQNLALALALAGRWAEARTIAGQDLPTALVDRRLGEWAMLGAARPGAARVALLLGIVPRSDPGQPERLALAPAPMADPVRLAAASNPPPKTRSDVPAFATTAAFTSVLPTRVHQPAPAAAPRPSTIKLASGVAPARFARPIGEHGFRARPRLAAYTVLRSAPSGSVARADRYVVQLGAFSSADRAVAAWRQTAPALGGALPLIGASGRLVRLSVGGFASLAAARATCRALGRGGQACFVRSRVDDRLAAWATPTLAQALAHDRRPS